MLPGPARHRTPGCRCGLATRLAAGLATCLVLALAVTAAAAAQGASAAPTLEAVAAACGAGPPTAATADAALALYARGVLEVARPCAVPLLRAARDAAGPPALRLAALRAAARLSSGEPSSAIADEVAALLGDLGGVVGEGAGAADATLALTRWQVRVEHGVLLALLRRSAEAEAALDTALAAAPSTADAAELLRARRCLAVALADGRRAAEAPARARAVLDESERLLGPDHVETLLAALGLGTLLWRVYELPAAELQYERAAAGFARVLGADHAYTLAARQGLGVLALRRGQFQGAVATLGAALVDARRTRADDDPDLAPLALAHASALAETGRLREAEAAFERLEAQQIARHGARDARTLDVQSMLAFVRYWLGDGRGTMRAAEAVLEGRVRSAEPHDPRRLAAEALYASALQLVGRSDEAARRLEQALAVARPVHGPGNDSVLQIELELALAYLESGRTAEALPLLQAIDAAFAGRPAELPHVRLMAEELLALALLRRGRAAEALSLAEAAWMRRRDAFGAASPLAAAAAVAHARAGLALGDAAGARAELEAALGTFEGHGDFLWRERFAARAALAQAADALGDARAARVARRRLVEDVERIRASLDDSPAVRQAYLRDWVPQYRQLALDEAAAARLAEAFRVAELARARTLLESLRSRRADESGPTQARDRAVLAALAGRIGVLDEALHDASDEARVALEAERSRVADELAALRTAIAARDARYAALLALPAAGPEAAAQVLQPGDLFVSYTVHEGRLLVTWFDRRGLPQARIARLAGSLRDAIEGWRALLLASPGRPAAPVWIDGERVVLGVVRPGPGARRAATADAVGALLARWLLEPLADALPATRRLVVAPDPALALLPFDALPWQGRPLVAAVDIAHVQSFGVLALLTAQPRARAAPRRLLAVADPAYEGGTTGRTRPASAVEQELRLSAPGIAPGEPLAWSALPGTRREALAVARLFAHRRLLLGAGASESELYRLAQRGTLGRYDVLHFATHGLISAQRPWSSALVLAAPPPGASEDGYLTALEFGRLGLASKLVVLSACDTATGNALEGEGVLGFPYVLLVSGAAATMLTLWPIDDAATARLMPAVLRGVRAGLAPSRALARAKREWIAHDAAAGARTWAGVVVYGL